MDYTKELENYFNNKKNELDRICAELKKIKTIVVIEGSGGDVYYFSSIGKEALEEIINNSKEEHIEEVKFGIVHTSDWQSYHPYDSFLADAIKYLPKIYVYEGMDEKLHIKH